MLGNHMAMFLKEMGRRLLGRVCIWVNKNQAAKWRKKRRFLVGENAFLCVSIHSI